MDMNGAYVGAAIYAQGHGGGADEAGYHHGTQGNRVG